MPAVAAQEHTGHDAPDPTTERRLRVLRDYGIIETAPDARFDEIVRLTARLFDVPTALVSFIEADRQWFKAKTGFTACETTRDVSFCDHVIRVEEVMVVLDATRDRRFADNPLVTGPPGIRFYCGIPLIAPCGTPIGSLCAIDTRPRPAPPAESLVILRDLAGMVMERLESHRAATARANAEASLEHVARVHETGVLRLDGDRIAAANAKAGDLLGASPDQLVGQPLANVADGIDAAVLEGIGDLDDEELRFNALVPRGDGACVPIAFHLAPLHCDEGATALATLIDVNAQAQARADLERLAHYDRLTGLMNRTCLEQAIPQRYAAASSRFAALIVVDLHRLRRINSAYGTAAGDGVLREAAERLTHLVRPGDLVARLSSDGFALFMTEVTGRAAVEHVCRRIVAAFDAAIEIQGEPCVVGVSLGAALFPEDTDDLGELLDHAAAALADAKCQGPRRHCFYQRAMGDEARRHVRVEQRLRQAIAAEGLTLAFQPKFATVGARISGVEALLRWDDPELGPVSPADFIPIAESAGLVGEVGQWALVEACREARRWGDLTVSVNLSPKQFVETDVVARIRDALRASGLAPSRLELELTEGVLVEDSAAALATLDTLKGIGVSLALDDFGTGYASLDYLQRFPFDRVKLDRAFLRGVGRNEESTTIVRAFLELSRGLGLASTVEGVETEAQLDFLHRHHCDEVQGFLLSRPLTAAALRSRLLQR